MMSFPSPFRGASHVGHPAPAKCPTRPVDRIALRRALISAALFALIPASTFGADVPSANTGSSLLDMSMEQLSQVEIKSDITSIRSKPLREQPGIVSVISNQEIRETGARDLSEILMLVPGFALDTDVESLVGLTFRGLQGQEGKVLLIVDGIEMNDPLYGSLPILDHIPADAIEQVEIIRGPGSAMYGGTAALSVIRVSTKGAAQQGGYATATPTYSDGRLAQSYAGGFGYTTNDWRISFNGAYSDTFISNQKYTSQSGKTEDLTHKSNLTPLFLDMGAGWHDLELRVIYDAYHYKDPVNYGEPPTNPIDTSFDSISTSAKYEIHPTTWLKITPQLTYRHATPWNTDSAENGIFNIATDRYQADLNAIAELTENSGLMLGMRYQRDEAHAIDMGIDPVTGQPIAPTYYGGRSSIAFNDYAGYAQYDLDTRWANFSVGGRYETQDAVGGHFVPRVAVTKAWQKFHLKGLYSEAARIPSINVVNSALGGNLEAEHTSDYEVEAGYRFTDSLSLIGNVFYMQVNKPIVYDSLTGTDAYFNGNKLGTAGYETELRYDRPLLSSHLGYSYYYAVENDVPQLKAQGARFLAAPAHKISFSETWHIVKGLDWNVNGFWLSERSAYLYANSGIGEVDPEFILNTFLSYRFHQFTFGVGAANLLDENRFAPQPYDGGVAPLPLKGREIFAKITYSF